MKKYIGLIIFLYLFLFTPKNVLASNIPLTIDSNGNITYAFSKASLSDIPSSQYIRSTFDISGNKLTLKSSTDKYYIDTSKELEITTNNNNASVYMLYTNKDITIKSSDIVSLGYFEDTTQSKTLNIKDTRIAGTGCSINNFKVLNIDNSNGPINHYNPVSTSDYSTSIKIKDSNIEFKYVYNISKLEIDNSDITMTYLNGKNLKFDINKSTFSSPTVYPNQETNTTNTIKKSTINNTSIQSTFKSTVNIENSTLNNVRFQEMNINANDSTLTILPWFCLNDFKNSKITFPANVNVAGLNLENSELTADNVLLQSMTNVESSYVMKDSKLNITNEFQFIAPLESSYDNVEFNMPQATLFLNSATIKNSKINTKNFTENGNNLIIDNTTINASNSMNLNPGGGNYTISNSTLNVTNFHSTNNTTSLISTKVISHNQTQLRYIDFKHSYILTDVSENNSSENASVIIINNNGINNIFATDLENNILEPTSSSTERREYSSYKKVLLRDKIKVTFKVENGTWDDNTTDDKVIEIYSYDKLTENQIPLGMIPNEGYEYGSWNKEIDFNKELNDDYTLTYVFKEKTGLINPPTGTFYPILLIISLIIGSIYVFMHYKKKIIFKKL